jgi:uncharacterized protein YgbK (DUF1537 family)
VLAIVGSVHPTACAQVARVEAERAARVASAATDVESMGRAIAAGEHVLVATGRGVSHDPLSTLAHAAAAIARMAAPRGLVLVGGETAQRVLDVLGVEALDVCGAPAPLVVRSRAVGGALDGVTVVTKGGSSGSPGALVEMIREAAA